MSADDWFQNVATFLVQKSKVDGKLKPMASAFFVIAKVREKYSYVYIVTARHNIENVDKESPLYARYNSIDNPGEYSELEIPHNSWVHHWRTDITVARIGFPLKPFCPVGFVPSGMILGSPQLTRLPIRVGSELLIATLFDKFPGTKRIQPLLRFGRVSLVPDEPVLAELGPSCVDFVEGYLVECLSWGGSSGAAVFTTNYLDVTSVSSDIHEVGTVKLLGVISGHYDISRVVQVEQVQQSSNPKESISKEPMLTVPFNAGIALVVPGQAILDIIMADEEVAFRESAFSELIS